MLFGKGVASRLACQTRQRESCRSKAPIECDRVLEFADAFLQLAACSKKLTEIAAELGIARNDFDTTAQKGLCLVKPPKTTLYDSQHLHG